MPAGASSIFLGTEIHSTTSLLALVDLVKKYIHEFKINTVTDHTYMAKFLLAVDDKRFQAWLLDCLEAEHHVEVDKDEIDFRSLIGRVRHNEFNIQLPMTFTTTSSDNKKSESKSFIIGQCIPKSFKE